MEPIEQARAEVGPEYTTLVKVDVITPVMPYDLPRVMAYNPTTGEVVEISLSSDANTPPQLRKLDAEEAAHVVKSGILRAM